MVNEVPQSDQSPAHTAKAAGDSVGAEDQRALILAAEIGLLKARIQNTEAILREIHSMYNKQRAVLDSWLEELATLKEGQLLLGIKEE